MVTLFHWELEDPHEASMPLSELGNFLLLLSLLVPALFYLVQLIRRDYHAFLALGPGGTPSTPMGYLRICVLKTLQIRNPLRAPRLPNTLHPSKGILKELPSRCGTRPQVEGIAPQRQVTQKTSSEMYQALSDSIKQLARRYPYRLYLGTSCFEKHSIGMFSHPLYRTNATCNGEVCHAHPSDGSMHLTLHPADIKTVLDRGWGQRHPISWESGWWKAKFVPPGFVMIYAPRDEKELAIVVQVIHAAAWWVSGSELHEEVKTGQEWNMGEDKCPICLRR